MNYSRTLPSSMRIG